jgi:chemotaxis protein histidine kinase CheA/ActR/RegA family two-component response regulator
VQNLVSPHFQSIEEQPPLSPEETLINATPILQQNLDIICSTNDEIELSKAVCEYAHQWNEIERATTNPALDNAIIFIKENLHQLAMSSIEERQQAQGVFGAFPDLIFDYIHDPQNQSLTLVSFLQNPDWLAPLSEQEAAQVLSLFQNPDLFTPLSEQDDNLLLESLSLNPLSKIEEIPQISDIKLNTNIIPIGIASDILNGTTTDELSDQKSDQKFEELIALDDILDQEQLLKEIEPVDTFLNDDFENESLEQSSNEIPFDELLELDALDESEQLIVLENNELNQEVVLQGDDFELSNNLEENQQLEAEELLNDLEEDPFAISDSELDSLEEIEQLGALNDLENSALNQEIEALSNFEENQQIDPFELENEELPAEMLTNAFAIEEHSLENTEETLNNLEENQDIKDPFVVSDSELDSLEETEQLATLNDLENNKLNQEIALQNNAVDPFGDFEETKLEETAQTNDPFGDFESPQTEIDPFGDFEETKLEETAQTNDPFGDFEETKLTENNEEIAQTNDPFGDFEETKIEEPLVEAIDPAVLLEPVNNALMAAFDDLSAATQRLVSADDDSEELLEAVGHYAETLQPVLDAAESNNLTGILEVGNFLNENVLALGMLPKAERQNLQENLDVFPALLLDYLLAPQESADGLIEHLKNPNWSSPLSEERAEEIKTTLLQIGQTPVEENSFNPLFGFDEEPVELETCSGEIYLGKPEQIERVNAAIIESAEALSTSLENFVSMQNDNELFLEAVDTYTTHVQNIWDAAEQAGLNGLQDVCNFVNENIMALSAEETEKRQLVHEQLDAWPMLILNYITSPAENIAPLVEHLQNPNWMMPLDESQADLLIKALQQGSTKTDAPIEDPFADSFGTTETTSVEETVEEDVSNDGDSEISLGNSEMLEMLSGEIESAQAELDEFLEKFVNTPNNKPEFAEIASNYNELVGRLALASEMVGLTGLQDVCNFVMSNVEILTEKSQSDRQKSKNALQKWPSLVLAYLKAPTNNIVALLNHFRENDWPSPLPDEKAHALLNNLRSSSSVPEDDGSEPSRATQAKPEDVALQIPEDVNQDLLAAYLQEAPQNAADFTACLQRIVKNPAPDDVKLGQRIAHTLKGSSNIIGIKGVATLAHNLEDILEYLFENAVPPPPALTKTMIEAADTLEIMIDSLQGKEEPPANALAILQEVLDWANRIDRNQLNVSDEEISKRKAEIAAQAANAPKPAAPTGGGAVAQAAAAGAPAEAGETEQFLRVPTRTVDNLLRLIGEMSISVGQIQERLKHVIHSTKSLNSQGMTVQHKGYELETLVVVRDVTNRRKHRLDDGKNIIAEDQQQAFDSLEFEQYNELHSLTHSFIESIADSRELGGSILEDLTALDGMFIHQERLNKEFQQIVMTTRMVPIKSIIARLERIVRQTCRSTEKLADLIMVGGDILIDGDVLTKLLDPLMHILRNSIDHGMELPADRVASGKPETGTVTIRCYRQGNNIVVKCEDDGRGLNFERIRQIAVDRGLITENQELSPRDLSRLILIPGFSTKGAVTQVSGRGVGMDVVHTSILELKGSLEIESETGRGSAIILILPMTLVTEHVLLVGVTTQKFALPTHHLAQALTPDSGEFRRIGDSLNFHMDKNAYPVMTLGDLLGLSGSPPATENDTRPLVLVRGESSITAVVVDYLYDSRNLVSKTMGRYVKKVRGVGGASILGDGSVVAMIDLPELLRSPAQSLMPLSSGNSEGETNAVVSAPHIMIVDDSLSVRKVLSQLIEDQGFKTMLAKDGLEAVEQVSQRKPDVMLVDMEMPRMNGIELTAHIRANEATKHIPIFMITSRTTEKHRQLAKEAGVSAYLTKPYQDTELLGLINDALRNKR